MPKKIPTLLLLWLAFRLSASARPCLADATALFEQAQSYQEAGQYEQAETVYKQILADHPATDNALASQERLTVLYIKQQKQPEAEGAYQKLLSDFAEHPGLPVAVDHVGDAYREGGEYEKALALYRHIVATWPQAEHAIDSQKNVVIVNMLSGESTAAHQAIDELLVKFAGHPKMPQAIETIAENYFDRQKYQPARQWYKFVVANWPDAEYAFWSHVGLAACNIALRDAAGAQAEIDKILADYADRDGLDRALEELGDNYFRSRQYDKAVGLYQRVVNTWPDSRRAMWAQRSLARSYILLPDEPNGLAAADKLLADHADNAGIGRAVRQVADSFSTIGNHDKAGQLYRLVLTHWPAGNEGIWAQTGLVTSRLRAWDLQGAEAELANLLTGFAAHEELPDVVHEIVEEYRNTGAHEEGRELFGHLLLNWYQNDETMLELQVGVALSNIMLAGYDKAEAAVGDPIADYNDNPNIAKALFQIAEQYYYARRYQACINLIELIRSKYPDKDFPAKSESPFILATCYRKLANYDKAIEYYQRTIEEYPAGRYSPWVPYSIGEIYMNAKKDYAQAVQWFEKQQELYPDSDHDKWAIFSAAECYFRLADYPNAADAFHRYIADYPKGLDLWCSYRALSECYAKMGDTPAALAVLQTAYEKADTDSLRAEFTRHINALTQGGAQ
ncbi:MAG: tetratricopeptide repeat protein [Planctomycetota bacterium]|jgi:tetratricopeptide (TPR) repeat protein